jgi:fatty-acyl-CoA synthase
VGWNFGDILDAISPVLPPDAPAFIHGERTVSWGEATKATNNLARGLIARGAVPGDKIAIYMRNRPEYLMALAAGFKARLTHVNVNYRYTPQEVWYIFDNSDAQTVVYASEFRDAVAQIRPRLPGVKTWIEVSGDGKTAPFAEPFARLAGDGNGGPLDIQRSGDDQFFIYTGGTTGMPKGVMWRQDDLFARLIVSGVRNYDVDGGVDAVREALSANPGGVTLMPACPLMHGTGSFTANTTLAEGGRVCLLENRRYDPVELLDTVEREKVNGLVIVGDPFSRPLLSALGEQPGHWDLSSLMMVISSGAMWSEAIKQELLAHHAGMLLVDAFSSSEALGMGVSISGAGNAAATAKFTLGPDVKVLTEDGHEVTPGSEEIGVLALGGRNPLGYYKDEEKSDRTFKLIDGVRYSIPGDFAQVETDGTIRLLGRGSVCINSGGEKIFPEEVEEALKTHDAVRDAVVVGIPHVTYGEQIVAVVELADGSGVLAEVELIDHVKDRLASYKAPRRVRVVETIGRAPNGKVDYKRHRAESIEELEPAT